MPMYVGAGNLQVFKTGTVAYLEGGTIEAYEAGTSTHKDTYPSIDDAVAGTNPNDWPVVLDARGEATIAISGATDLVFKDADGNVIKSIDGLDQSSDVYDSDGNTLIHYIPTLNAVNSMSVANATLGNAAQIKAYGTATDIGISLSSKGAGTLFLDGGGTGAVTIGNTSTGNINLKQTTAVTGGLSVSSNTTLSGTLAVTGAGTFSSSLAVTTSCTIGTSAAVGTTLTVTGAATLNSSLTVAGTATFNGNIVVSTAASFTFVPAGTIFDFAGSAAPSGWLACDGSAVSRTTYAVLFAAIGTAWGAGNGSTTFNIPDLRRRSCVGSGGTGTANLANSVGSTGGNETVTITNALLPNTVPCALGGATASDAQISTGSANHVPATNNNSTWGTGSGGAVNMYSPVAVVIKMIKV